MASNFQLKAIISMVDKMSGPMRKVSSSLGGLSRRIGDVGAAGAGLASAFAIKQVAQDAIGFESAMAGVKKVVDFPTPEGFAQMRDDILEMSKRIPVTAEGLAQIVAAAGQSGIARGELASFAEDAAKMAVAFDITADEAGEMMAKFRTAFKMDQGQVRELADQINYLGNTSPANAAQISDVVRRVGALGDVGGVAAKYVAALGATMVGAGAESEVAATATKNFILGLTKGSAATRSAKEAFASLGISTTTLAMAMQKDATGAIETVLKALQKLAPDKQAPILTQIFGSESAGAIASLLTNTDALGENFLKVGDAARYAGAMQKEYDGQADTTANKLQLFSNQWTALKINLGNAVLPILKDLLVPLGKMVGAVGEFAKQNPTLTKYALAFIGIAGAVGGAVGAISLAAGAIGLLGAAALPVIGVAAAVAGLGMAAYALYDNWDGIAGWFGNLWGEVRAAFDEGFVSGVWELIKTFNPTYLIGKAINDLIAYLTGVDLAAYGATVVNSLWDGFKAKWGELVTWLSDAVKGLTAWMPDWVLDKLGLSAAVSAVAAPVAEAMVPAGGMGQQFSGGEAPAPGPSPVLAAAAGTQKIGGSVDININGLTPGSRVETDFPKQGPSFNVDAGYRSPALGF